MSEKKGYVLITDCAMKHTQLVEQMGYVKVELSQIKYALVGNPLKGEAGLVQIVNDIKKNSKSRLTGRDKALIVGSFLTALSSIVAALIAVIT